MKPAAIYTWRRAPSLLAPVPEPAPVLACWRGGPRRDPPARHPARVVNPLVAVLAALGASSLFAVAAAFQHRSAVDAPAALSLRPRGIAPFVKATLTHKMWLAGTSAELAGFGLHAVALHTGGLTLVQPILVSNVLFAFPLNHRLHHSRPSRRELAWAAVVVVGLAGFIATATLASTSSKPPDPTPAALAAAGAVVAAFVCVALGRRRAGTASAALLGVSAGIAFAGTAALIKTSTDLLVSGVGALLSSWPLYALLAVGAAALTLNQLAFQAGPLSASLPAITTVNPLLSVVIGLAVYDEPIRHSPLALASEALALGVLVTAAIALTLQGHPPAVAAPPMQGPSSEGAPAAGRLRSDPAAR